MTEPKDKGFSVQDKRFTSTSREAEEEGVAHHAPPADNVREFPRKHRSAAPSDEKQGRTPGPAPAPSGGESLINFATFVLSLAANTNIHLGVMANPVDGKTSVDLQLARQTIDILEMLQEKTRGNLEDEERQLLESVLYDLRMKYVAATQPSS